MKPGHTVDAAGESFYHLRGIAMGQPHCQGLACFAARGDAPAYWAEARAALPALFCRGQCHQPPTASGNIAPPHIEVHARHTVLLGNVLRGGARDMAAYLHNCGAAALQQALNSSPGTLLKTISESGLRGRGGAGFAAGRKWQAVAAQEATRKYLVVNADEGDPGSFSDKLLLEDDPFLLIEACIIASFADRKSTRLNSSHRL